MSARVFSLERLPLRGFACMSTAGSSPKGGADWAQEMREIAVGRDRAAFLRVYDHFMGRLCLYLRGLGSPDPVAEELAQEALLKLWQHAASYDAARSTLGTWLFRIARNLHLDSLRRDSGQAFVAESAIDDELEVEGGTTEVYADQLQLQRRIDALSPVQARLMRMSFLEARSHQEIAAELGMPLGTVKSHLRRAFLRLQGELGGES
jgi:RNA polymerase sigma-70 factor (ECF subfamily)